MHCWRSAPAAPILHHMQQPYPHPARPDPPPPPPPPAPPPPRAAAGRAEVLSLLQRRRHPELLESELEKKKLQRSVLGVRWHVADMVGSGALLRIPTTVGPLLRVAKRGR